MNRFPTIRRALFATVISLSAGLAACCPPEDDIDRQETITDKEFEAELTACLTDDLACEDLCRMVIIARGYEGDPEFEPPSISRCIVQSTSATTYALDMTYSIPVQCVGGRRPAALGPTRCAPAQPSAVGRWLADLAHLEAASIYAFVELARELQHHGAPTHLVRRALESAADERRHAAIAAKLSLEHGVTPALPKTSLSPVRPLVEIARTNAVEGCVRELYGAAVALWQGTAATVPAYREIFARIAADELRHAELAFDVHGWCSTRLDASELAEVGRARAAAAIELVAIAGSADRQIDPSLVDVLGLPDRARALELATAVGRSI